MGRGRKPSRKERRSKERARKGPPPAEVRYATSREEIAAYYRSRGKPTPPYTMTAMIGYVQGEPLGIGGVANVEGYLYAFVDVAPRGKIYKKEIYGGMLQLLNDQKERGAKMIFAERADDAPDRLFTKLGFRRYNPHDRYWVLELDQ